MVWFPAVDVWFEWKVGLLLLIRLVDDDDLDLDLDVDLDLECEDEVDGGEGGRDRMEILASPDAI